MWGRVELSVLQEVLEVARIVFDRGLEALWIIHLVLLSVLDGLHGNGIE